MAYCYSCPDNPGNVICLEDVAGMTQAEALAQYLKFPNDPVEVDDMGNSYFEDNCWCRDCVVVHEQSHINDWIPNFLQSEVNLFATWCANHAINIDCSINDSTDCSTALSTAVKSEYDDKWEDRIDAAGYNWNNSTESEEDAMEAKRDCYQAIVDALYEKAYPE